MGYEILSLKEILQIYFEAASNFTANSSADEHDYWSEHTMEIMQKEIDRRGCSYQQIQAVIDSMKEVVTIKRIYSGDGEIKGYLEYKPRKGMTMKDLQAKSYNNKGYRKEETGFMKISDEFISGGWTYDQMGSNN